MFYDHSREQSILKIFQYGDEETIIRKIEKLTDFQMIKSSHIRF